MRTRDLPLSIVTNVPSKNALQDTTSTCLQRSPFLRLQGSLPRLLHELVQSLGGRKRRRRELHPDRVAALVVVDPEPVPSIFSPNRLRSEVARQAEIRGNGPALAIGHFEAWEEHLTGLGFMAPAPDGRHVCSIVGLVLFGHGPRRWLPQAGIRWMAFAGDSKEYQALDDARLDGPLVALTRRLGGASVEVIEPGVLERAVDRMTPVISTEDAAVDEGLCRQRRWHYPPEALLEALR